VFDSGCGDSFFELEVLLFVVSSADFPLVSPEYLFDSIVLKHLDCLFQPRRQSRYEELYHPLIKGVSYDKGDARATDTPYNFELGRPTSYILHCLCVGSILRKDLLVEAGELKQTEVGVDVPAPSIQLPTGRGLGIRVGT
jgi:hypothetical protein